MEWRKQARSRSGAAAAASSTANTPRSTVLNNPPTPSSSSAALAHASGGGIPASSVKRSRMSLGAFPSSSSGASSLLPTEHTTQHQAKTNEISHSSGLPLAPIQHETMGATQRFRLAKEQRRLQQQQELMQFRQSEMVNDENISQGNGYLSQSSSRAPSLSASPIMAASPNTELIDPLFSQESAHSVSLSMDDGDYGGSRHRRGKSKCKTPNRRMSISGGAKKMRRRSVAVSNLSIDRGLSQERSALNTSNLSFAAVPSNSQQSLDETILDDSVNNNGSIGLKSRVIEMQQRIQRLEREKMELSMSKAPLESRLRQAEEAWSKEQHRFIQEIESMKSAAKDADERFLSLEMERDSLKEETSRLMLAARKASSTLHSDYASNDRELAELKEKYRHATEEIHCLKIDKISLESDLKATNMELDSLFRTHEDLQDEFKEVASAQSQSSDAVIQLEALTTEHIATSAQLNAVCADLAETKSNNQAAMVEIEEERKREVDQLKFEISVLRARRGNWEEDEDGDVADVEDEAVLRARIEERDNRISELEEQLFKSEQLRRVMHNRIQELRGNIRVFVRTRPFLPGDGNSTDSPIIVAPDGESLDIVRGDRDKQSFGFDKVFAPSAGQESVFTEVSDFVQSALDGYNVCLFSYGQTGSGKTHTMQGSGNGAMRGIIPRAVEQILTQADILRSQKWQFTMAASFLEIYNENLRDLLISLSNQSATKTKAKKLSIKRDIHGKSYVDGLTKIKIDTKDPVVGMEQLENVMVAATRSRSVASTKMNSQSSRSHSVFILHLQGVNEENGTVVEGSLNLCDLAGSERLDRSGAANDAKRLRETQAINKSLSCLGDVFTSLANGASHIPFRNSKLTYLLQDCLSGDGKALMFVNLSPTVSSSHESICSLRFAQRVNQVELGKATKHVQYLK